MIADAFSPNWCCQINPTSLQELSTKYYGAIGRFVEELMEEIYQAEMYGKPVEHLYNKLNNFNYLFGYLLIIVDEINNDAINDAYWGTGCGQNKGMQYYEKKYHLSCIAKKFFCLGFDITSLLTLFGLNPNNTNLNGIGFMSIAYHGNPNCKNNINPFIIH